MSVKRCDFMPISDRLSYAWNAVATLLNASNKVASSTGVHCRYVCGYSYVIACETTNLPVLNTRQAFGEIGQAFQ